MLNLGSFLEPSAARDGYLIGALSSVALAAAAAWWRERARQRAGAAAHRQELQVLTEALARSRDCETSLTGLTDILAQSPDIVVTFYANGDVGYANRAAATCLSRQAARQSAAPAPATLSQLFDAAVQRQILEEGTARAAREGVWSVECCLGIGEGGGTPCLVRVMQHWDRSGGGRYYSLVARDLTQQKENLRLERERLASDAANQAKSHFLANMSHEIRTPLAAILGFSELLMSGARVGAEARRDLDRIHRNALHLLDLVDAILDLSKIEAGQIDIQTSEVEVAALLGEVLTTVRPSAAAKGIRLVEQHSAGVPATLVTDQKYLRQILINLLGNAVKFTDAGQVTLTTAVDDIPGATPTFAVTVEDTGRGIDEEAEARLFQPFSQGDVSTARRYGGAGLGLALARRLAHALHGTLELLSSQPGRGSVFQLRLPLARPSAASMDPVP